MSTNFPHGVSSYGLPVLGGSGILPLLGGSAKVFFVDGANGSDGNNGKTPTGAFKVTTVHDLAPIKFPESTHPKVVAVHRRRLEWVKKEVDRVIVPSNATKKDIVSYGVKEERVIVIPEAAPVLPMVKSKKKDYILAIGINPRKNTTRIIEAAKKVGIKLVLVGLPSYIDVKDPKIITKYIREVFQYIDELNETDHTFKSSISYHLYMVSEIFSKLLASLSTSF